MSLKAKSTLLVLLLVTGCSFASTTRPAEVQEDDLDRYERILNEVLPVDLGLKPGELADKYRWAAVIRIDSDPRDPESSIRLRRLFDGEIEATLTEIPPPSIWNRILEGESTLVGEGAKGGIRLLSRSATEETCPGLEQLADDFETIRVSPVPAGGLILDAASYHVVVAASLDEHRFSVSGGKLSKRPLIRWAEELRSHLRACGRE